MRIQRTLGIVVVLASARGGRDQLHHLLDVLLYPLKFAARQIELRPGSGNLRVRSDGRDVLQVDVNRFAAGFRQFHPDRSARDAAAAEEGSLEETEL